MPSDLGNHLVHRFRLVSSVQGALSNKFRIRLSVICQWCQFYRSNYCTQNVLCGDTRSPISSSCSVASCQCASLIVVESKIQSRYDGNDGGICSSPSAANSNACKSRTLSWLVCTSASCNGTRVSIYHMCSRMTIQLFSFRSMARCQPTQSSDYPAFIRPLINNGESLPAKFVCGLWVSLPKAATFSDVCSLPHA